MPRPATKSSKPDTVPWTASRCLRLLRPITSRIEPLRRLHTERKRVEGLQDRLSKIVGPNDDDYGEPADPADPIWMPQEGQPSKPSRTYHSRLKRKRSHDQSDERLPIHATPSVGKIDQRASDALPTPFRLLPSATPQTRSIVDYYPNLPPSSPLTPYVALLRPPVSRSNVSRGTGQAQKSLVLEKGLLDAIAALLDRTAPMVVQSTRVSTGRGARGSENAKRKAQCKGPSSLQAICLRAIPAFITNEYLWAHTEDPDDDSDITAEVYTAVEAMRPPDSPVGYSELKVAVRSHGLQLLDSLLREGVFSSTSMIDLIHMAEPLCTRREYDTILLGIIAACCVTALPRLVEDSKLVRIISTQLERASLMTWAQLVTVEGLDWRLLLTDAHRGTCARLRKACSGRGERLCALARIVSATMNPPGRDLVWLGQDVHSQKASVQSFPWPSTMIVVAIISGSLPARHDAHAASRDIRSQLFCLASDAVKIRSGGVMAYQTKPREFQDVIMLGALALQCALPLDNHAALTVRQVITVVGTAPDGISHARHVNYLVRLLQSIVYGMATQDKGTSYRLYQMVLPSFGQALKDASDLGTPAKLLGQTCLHLAKIWAKNDPKLIARRFAHEMELWLDTFDGGTVSLKDDLDAIVPRRPLNSTAAAGGKVPVTPIRERPGWRQHEVSPDELDDTVSRVTVWRQQSPSAAVPSPSQPRELAACTSRVLTTDALHRDMDSVEQQEATHLFAVAVDEVVEAGILSSDEDELEDNRNSLTLDSVAQPTPESMPLRHTSGATSIAPRSPKLSTEYAGWRRASVEPWEDEEDELARGIAVSRPARPMKSVRGMPDQQRSAAWRSSQKGLRRLNARRLKGQTPEVRRSVPAKVAVRDEDSGDELG